MNLKKKFIIFYVLLLSVIPCFLISQQVLIWDNDNNSDYYDPEGAGFVGCEYGIQQALTAIDVTYETVTNLPGDLSSYDVVFVTLGIYCLG